MTRKERIRDILQKAGRPLTTNSIAEELGVDWHTAHDDLQAMEQAGEVQQLDWEENLKPWRLTDRPR